VTEGLAGQLTAGMTSKVTYKLTACTLRSALGPTLGNECGENYLFTGNKMKQKTPGRRKTEQCHQCTQMKDFQKLLQAE